MAETTKKAAAPQVKPITVKSGVQEIPFNGAGKTIASVRGTLGKVLNLGADMRAFLKEPGKDAVMVDAKDEESLVIPEGATLEFVKAAGQKG